jgi:hypothetical protein
VLILTVFAMTVLSMTFNTLSAQQGSPVFTGKITDETGKPLPGVTVKVKGSKVAVTTNEVGEFKIGIPENTNKILEISYVGMESQEVKVGNQQHLAISKPVASEQQEVVV